MKDKILPINLKIAGRHYPMRIDRNEEEHIRKAAKIINEIVLQYRQRYGNNDMQDFLAMTALHVVRENIDLKDKADEKPFVEEVERLNNYLSDFIREQ